MSSRLFNTILIPFRRTVCRFRSTDIKVFQDSVFIRKPRWETQKLTCKLDQNQNNEEDNHINGKLQRLQLEDPVLKRFRRKRDVVREIDAPSLLDISKDLTVEDYNALRRKLEINVQLECDNFQPQENEEYKSPRKLVSILAAHGDANREAVKKLFATQYEFKWRTETGDPDQFSFYGFCQDLKDAGGEDVMTYDTRKAHVISRLYHAQEKLHKIRRLTHRQLCPPVYVRTSVDKRWTWKKWICNRDRSVFEATDGETDIDWITNVPLRDYITVHSVQNYRDAAFPNGENHLYWAVLEEDDFGENQSHAAHGDNLGTTQVYVGKAMHGIKDRWVANTKSHCRNMELSRNIMYNMMNYDQNTLEGQQLVDLRFLLHKADTHHQRQEGDRCGLFIMGQQGYGDGENVERRSIEGVPLQLGRNVWHLTTTNMKFGMNCF